VGHDVRGLPRSGWRLPSHFIACLIASIDRLPVIDACVSVRNGDLLIFACEAAGSGLL